MQNETLKQIEAIYSITSNIFNLYNLLIKMEILGKNQSKEYQNIFQLLFLTIENEKKIYDYFQKNPKEIISAYIFLKKKDNESNFDYYDDFELVLEQKPFDLIKARINSHFNKYMITEPLNFVYYLDEEDIECIANESEEVGFKYLYEIIPTIYKTAKIRLTSYLENIIKYQHDLSVKSFLINARLFLSFIDLDLEQHYLNYGFQNMPNVFEEEIKIETKVQANTDEKAKNLYGKKILNDALTPLFDLVEKEDFYHPDIYKKNLFYLGLLQTSILYFSENGLIEQKNELYNKLKIKIILIPTNDSSEILLEETEEEKNILNNLYNQLDELNELNDQEGIKNLFKKIFEEFAADINSTIDNIQNENIYKTILDSVFNHVDEIKRTANKDLYKYKKEI